MKRKLLALSLSLTTALSVGVYTPQVLAAENQLGSEAIVETDVRAANSSSNSTVAEKGKEIGIDYVSYVKYSDHVEVKYCDRMWQYQKVTIPPEIDGIPVTKICEAAFNGCIIQEIIIPETIEEIEGYAFSACTLETIKLPDNLKKISTGLLSQSSIKEVVIPEGVTEIGNDAFSSCSKLETITIPKNVKKIGSSAFSGCPLKEIIVSEENPYFISENGGLFNSDKTELLAYAGKYPQTTYNIPESVKKIYSNAFYCSSYLTEINIPESVVTIGPQAFGICLELVQLKIPSSVQKLPYGSISSCRNLSAVYLPKSITEIESQVFATCKSLTDIYYEGSEADWEAITKPQDWSTDATIHYNSYNNTNYELNLRSSKSTFFDDEDTLTYFYVDTDYEGEKITLVNADDLTEYDMLDDGKFSVSGDDLPSDGVYSAKLTLDTSGTSYDKVKTISFYAVTEDGVKSDTITIKITKRFTDLQIKEMSAVDKKIRDMMSTDDYITADYDKKVLMIKELLTDISINGTEEYNYSLINPDSISLSDNGQYYDAQYYFGFPITIFIGKFDQVGDVNYDGSVTVTDIVMLQKWLVKAGEMKRGENADVYKDGKINVFDLCALKKIILYKPNFND